MKKEKVERATFPFHCLGKMPWGQKGFSKWKSVMLEDWKLKCCSSEI